MSSPAWWNKDRERRNIRSRNHERKVAKETGGRVQAGSGSSWRAPQDVKSSDYLIEHKYTDGDRIPFTAGKWLRGVRNALQSGREFCWIVDFDKWGFRVYITSEPPAGLMAPAPTRDDP